VAEGDHFFSLLRQRQGEGCYIAKPAQRAGVRCCVWRLSRLYHAVLYYSLGGSDGRWIMSNAGVVEGLDLAGQGGGRVCSGCVGISIISSSSGHRGRVWGWRVCV